MENLSLTDLELKNLINLYKSELRKLVYQVNKTSSTIAELENSMQGTTVSEIETPYTLNVEKQESSADVVEEEKPKPKKSRGRGRPKGSKNKKSKSSSKDEAETATTKKRGRGRPKGSKTQKKGKRKRVVKGGYKLSNWDNMILNELSKADNPLIASDFIPSGKKLTKKEGSNMSETDVKNKISRSIHKLANKRKTIKKVKKEGRGNAYVLA